MVILVNFGSFGPTNWKFGQLNRIFELFWSIQLDFWSILGQLAKQIGNLVKSIEHFGNFGRFNQNFDCSNQINWNFGRSIRYLPNLLVILVVSLQFWIFGWMNSFKFFFFFWYFFHHFFALQEKWGKILFWSFFLNWFFLWRFIEDFVNFGAGLGLFGFFGGLLVFWPRFIDNLPRLFFFVSFYR